MSSTVQKIILIFGIISFVLFMGLISAAWYMGMFSSVEIKMEESGPYNFVYLEHQGPYYLTMNKIDQVEKYLIDNSVEYIHSAGIYFDNPSEVAENELKSFGGFLIKDSLIVQPPFKLLHLKKRKTVIASIEAHPMVAPFKVYPAFEEWLDNNKKIEIVGPPMELYLPGGDIEVHFPYQNKI